MTYVITELCIRDGACAEVCPVACIHSTPDAPQFYIDPERCIDCNACALYCPVTAIFSTYDLPEEWQSFTRVNADFFKREDSVLAT